MQNQMYNGFVESVSNEPAWWITSLLLGLFQPIYGELTHSSMAAMGMSQTFLAYLVPTILGCLFSVYKSKKPWRERWAIVVSSILFNGYILETLSLWLIGLVPNSAGYFLGGMVGYFIFEFFYVILEQLNTKGVNLIWRFAKNKVDSGMSLVDEFTGDDKIVDEMGYFIDVPKRKKKNSEQKH